MVGKDNLIHLPELWMSFPSLRKHLSELYNITINTMAHSQNPNHAKEDSLKVKDWYTKTYSDDELGEEINNDITFGSLWNHMSQGDNVYAILGVYDSVVRERVFEKLAEIRGVEYDVIYKQWLSSDKYANGGALSSDEMDRYNELTQKMKSYLEGGTKMSSKEIAEYSKLKHKRNMGSSEEYRKQMDWEKSVEGRYEYSKGGGVGEYAESKFDSSVAKLREYIRKYPYIWTKNGKEYVPIEGWQFAGLILGYSTRVTEVTPTANGYMAKAEVVDAYNNVVCSGFGLVDKSESKWSGKPEYQLVGFAQTRAVSRALRNCLSWMVKAAGFNTTPAEEMYGVTPEKRGKMSGPRTFMPPMQSAKAEDTGFVFDRPEYQTVSPIEPVSAPMPKSENAEEVEETLRQMKAKAMANNIVIKSPDFMKEIDKALLGSDTDLQLSILKSSVMYMDENNIILQTPRYMSKLRKIANQEPF